MFVCVSYIHYPVSIGRYFKAALQRRTDIELVSVGHGTGNRIPWQGGMTLPYSDTPDIQLPQTMQYPMEAVEAQIKNRYGKVPDLYIQIDAGFHLVGTPKSGLNFMVATDSHCLNDWYDYDRRAAHKFFNMHQFYMKHGDIPLPYAYDPVWHRKIEERTDEYDAVLIGVMYDHRKLWYDALRAAGVKVLMHNGASFEDARNLYAQGKVGLNWGSLADLNARSFEIKAMGLPCVENMVPDLRNFFDETQTVAFSDNWHNHEPRVGDATKAVVDLLGDSERMSKIALAGNAAVQPHTYDARIETVLSHMR